MRIMGFCRTRHHTERLMSGVLMKQKISYALLEDPAF